MLQITLQAQSLLIPVVDSIPMRDTDKLAADVYIPSGCTTCPTILIQTPYGREMFHLGLPLGIGQNINSSNYIFVVVDWRGTGGSLAAFDPSVPRGYDGYDCIEWITQQSWSDGKVATWGPSALGKCQFQTAKEQHPAHICAIPQVAGPQFDYLEYYHGGVYRTEYLEQLDILGYNLSSTILANQVHNITWTVVENQNFYPTQINIPMFMQGGWYDHNIEVMIDFFNALRSSSPIAVRDQHRLLMGPWVHGGHGAAHVGSAIQGQLTYLTAEDWNDSLGLLFLDYHMRGINNGWNTTDFIQYFQMGEDNWKTSAVWPPTNVIPTKLYLQNNSTLASGIPTNGTGFSMYIFDPSDPSPTIGGPTLRFDLNQGPYNQAPVVESRGDVLIFDSPVLGQDVVLSGKIRAHLFVSTDRIDTDFAIRLTDVYPDGRSMLVQDGIRRLRFRDGYNTADTAAAIPMQVYEIDIELANTAITFLAGHKIRIDITSSIYPRFDVNLNNGGTMYAAGDTLMAINRVYHNINQASYVEFMLEDFIGNSDEIIPAVNAELFPNPTTNSIQLKFDEDVTYQILDLQGRILKAGIHNSGTTVISVNELSSGFYLIKLSSEKINISKNFVKH